jgi:hypothetical protein
VKTFNGSPWFVRTCIVQVYVSTVEWLLRECKVIPSSKLGTAVSQKDAA